MTKVLFSRADFEDATKSSGLMLAPAINYFTSKGLRVDDLDGSRATKANVDASISSEKPAAIISNGHGDDTRHTLFNYEVVYETCSCDELNGVEIVYLFSCLNGRSLVPDAVEKGARAVIGYNQTFGWVQTGTNPLTDTHASGTAEAVQALAKAIADGKTAQECVQASTTVWDQQIAKWQMSSDSYAAEVLKWMLSNRNAQVLAGDPNARLSVQGPAIPAIPIPKGAAISVVAGLLLLLLAA